MKRCVRCVMPDTRPGITFENGVCSACINFERRKNIDWGKRFEEFEELCSKYRGKGMYDCAIAVSGGKDSHFQVHVMKEIMKMNPILFTVEDNFDMTEAGKHNLKNISEEFGCHIISLKPDIKTQKVMMRKTFEESGKPTWYIDRLIYTYPLHMALRFDTPLLVYGENISFEYGGTDAKETYSAKEQINNGVAEDLGYDGLLKSPDVSSLDPMYLSYFVPWNSYDNYLFASSRGFHDLTHEWKRTHCIEDFDQVDSRAYLVHPWMKYPKFGHATATDYASRFIRYGMMTRDEGMKLVEQHDSKLDPLCVRDFCKFLGYAETEFWKIVDKFYNKDIFEYDGQWRLKCGKRMDLQQRSLSAKRYENDDR